MALDTSRIRNPEILKWTDDHLRGVARIFELGAPVVDDVDKIVTTANMKNGAYTIAAQPDVTRTISVSHTAVDAADNLGTIVLVGTDNDSVALTETITPLAGSIVYSTNAFKTITSATGAGWVKGGGNDTITIGVGPKLGLPFVISATANVCLGILGTAFVVPTATAGGTLATSTIDLSSGTYNGTKKAFAVVVE